MRTDLASTYTAAPAAELCQSKVRNRGEVDVAATGHSFCSHSAWPIASAPFILHRDVDFELTLTFDRRHHLLVGLLRTCLDRADTGQPCERGHHYETPRRFGKAVVAECAHHFELNGGGVGNE